MKLFPILATVTFVAGSVGAAAPASAAALTTTCDGFADNVTIPGNLFVPAGRSCQLTNVDVTGSTEVSFGADLLVTGGTFTGNVVVRDNGALDAVDAQFEGNISNRGFGVFAEATHFGGNIITFAVNDATIPFTYLVDAHVAGRVSSRGADALLDGTEVGGSVSVVEGDFADAYDSSLLGALTLTGTGSSVVCESEVHGDAAFTGIWDGLQLGTTGSLADCAGPSVWLGNVAVDDSTGGVEVNGNVVLGDLSGEGNDPAPTGADNRVRGEVSGQFADLAPAPEAGAPEALALTAQAAESTVESPLARKDRLTVQVDQRRSATAAEATAAGPIG